MEPDLLGDLIEFLNDSMRGTDDRIDTIESALERLHMDFKTASDIIEAINEQRDCLGDWLRMIQKLEDERNKKYGEDSGSTT